MRALDLCLQHLGKRMSLSLETTRADGTPPVRVSEALQTTEPGYRVIRRNGSVTPFDPFKITVALTKAFLAVEGNVAAGSRRVHDVVEALTADIVATLKRRSADGRLFHIEDIQDQVELALMRSENHKVARAYVLYREVRAQERAKAITEIASDAGSMLTVTHPDGSSEPLDDHRLARIIDEACEALEGGRPPLYSPRRGAISMMALRWTNFPSRRSLRRAPWSRPNPIMLSSPRVCFSTSYAARR